MQPRLPVAPMLSQGNSTVPEIDAQDNELVLLRHTLREAIEESGEKKEAVAAAMGLPDAAYLSKLFSGEKPLTARHLVSLPEAVERIFARRYAETQGLIVVEPLSGIDAVHSLVSGLVGVLAPHLPVRASRMAHATVRPRTAKVVAR
jgi:hypothetical protein